MAALTVLTDGKGRPRVTQVFNQLCKLRSYLAVSTGVTNGKVGYVTSAGRIGHANAGSSGKQQYQGIIILTASDGQGVDVLEDGYVDGYDLTPHAYGTLVYLGNVDGELNTTAGTMTVPIGRVEPISDRDPATGLPSKVLHIFPRPATNFT